MIFPAFTGATRRNLGSTLRSLHSNNHEASLADAFLQGMLQSDVDANEEITG